jgi:serine/threonine protein phosphatase 1
MARQFGKRCLERPALRIAVISLFKRRSRKKHRLPRGVRVYAVGDIHGRIDLLEPLLEKIDLDLAARPCPRPVEIFLGDYIDRGPGSREVIDRLIGRSQSHETVILKGNHETFPLEFLKSPAVLAEWRNFGGLQMLMSYGIQPSMNPDPAEQIELAQKFRDALPPAHATLLATMLHSFTLGDFFFVHAGVKPGVPLDRQAEEHLLWIKEEFLLSDDDYGKMIVHGHTPVAEPDFHPNRINVDTGAYATGKLTCLVIEDDRTAIL